MVVFVILSKLVLHFDRKRLALYKKFAIRQHLAVWFIAWHYLAVMNQRRLEWYGHIAFWLAYLSLRLFVIRLYPGTFTERLLIELAEIPVKAMALYSVIFAVQKFLAASRWFTFVVALIMILLVTMWLNRVEDYFVIYPLTESAYVRYDEGFWAIRAAFVNLIYIYPVVGIGATIYFVKSWIENRFAKEMLAREKAEIELKVLKDQLHPHFLFNTLNNLYSLALMQSDKMPAMMLRLSGLLQYMVYDATAPSVKLKQELSMIDNYIALEKLRLENRLAYSFTTEGDLDAVHVSPLLIFPLIENAFKHGSHQTSDLITISLRVTVVERLLTIVVENTVPAVKREPAAKGVGLTNLRKRLDILYPGHELTIQSCELFSVSLKIVIL